jgi:hypothetical protein
MMQQAWDRFDPAADDDDDEDKGFPLFQYIWYTHLWSRLMCVYLEHNESKTARVRYNHYNTDTEVRMRTRDYPKPMSDWKTLCTS